MHHLRATLDPSGMYEHLSRFPSMWREGHELSASIGTDWFEMQRLRSVLVTGMGGSAIGGDLMRTFVESTAPVPVFVNRSYSLPAFVNESTVVIASSYSGNTEETLSAFEAAVTRGATVFCITSGGTLLERARAHGFSFLQIPGGVPPRAALPYSLAPLLTLAERLGLVTVDEADWQETSDRLDAGVDRLGNLDGNAAMELAGTIQGHFPVVYSGLGFLEAVNVRWRGQLEENAKTIAYGNFFPELNHNEIVGWAHSASFLSQIGVLALRDRDDSPRVKKRIDVTRDLLAERAAFWREFESDAESRLARMLTLVQFGDWVSLYLAWLNKVDATPVHLIDRLKAELSRA